MGESRWKARETEAGRSVVPLRVSSVACVTRGEREPLGFVPAMHVPVLTLAL